MRINPKTVHNTLSTCITLGAAIFLAIFIAGVVHIVTMVKDYKPVCNNPTHHHSKNIKWNPYHHGKRT